MHYVFQAFAPSILLIILNFCSYWIPRKAVPARVALIVTTFLTSTFILQSATESVVRISYVSPMQLFLVVHVFFIVVSVIQYILVLTIFPKVSMVVVILCEADATLSGSSHQSCSVGKGVLRNFSKFTGKHLYQNLFFNKVANQACNFIKKETLAQVFSCEFCEIP